jgi:hypothetical protein
LAFSPGRSTVKYSVSFCGRKINAIGVISGCRVETEAASALEAASKVYDTHEHIRGVLTVNASGADFGSPYERFTLAQVAEYMKA